MERVVTPETGKKIQVTTLPPEMLIAAKKVAGIPRELNLRANFILGPINLEQILNEVRIFYKKKALFYTKNDEDAEKTLLGGS